MLLQRRVITSFIFKTHCGMCNAHKIIHTTTRKSSHIRSQNMPQTWPQTDHDKLQPSPRRIFPSPKQGKTQLESWSLVRLGIAHLRLREHLRLGKAFPHLREHLCLGEAFLCLGEKHWARAEISHFLPKQPLNSFYSFNPKIGKNMGTKTKV